MKKFAHKFAYIAGGIIIGVVFSTSAGAFADTVKSMVGKKVSGEYTIIVDGKKLSDKGAVIDSRANVPARSLSEALGADVKVSGKTINITSEAVSSNAENSGENPSSNSTVTNKYAGYSKSSLESLKTDIETKILKPTKEGREEILKEIAVLEETETQGIAVPALVTKRKQLAEYDGEIVKYENDLSLINAALTTAK